MVHVVHYKASKNYIFILCVIQGEKKKNWVLSEHLLEIEIYSSKITIMAMKQVLLMKINMVTTCQNTLSKMWMRIFLLDCMGIEYHPSKNVIKNLLNSYLRA